MSPSGSGPRVSITANRGVTGALFGLAIITYATRTYIRARILKQFSTEDVFLLLAVVCLCCSTGLAYSTLQDQYDALAVILHGAQSSSLFPLLDKLPKISRESASEYTLWWFVIFPVKLAYLFFFRRLISRLQGLNIWWWCVTVLTVLMGLVCVAAVWITCPYFTNEGVLSCIGPAVNTRVVRDSNITIVMDVLSDILVVSIPIALLWRVRINIRQKIGLGVLLCLSLVMVIISIIRISGMNLADGAVDLMWGAFWVQQEGSIAVIMMSVSAFRTFFVPHASSKISPDPAKPSSYWRKKLLLKRAASARNNWDGDVELPQIPRATLTGMRSAIRGAGMSETDDVC